jgi:hypothetical protein
LEDSRATWALRLEAAAVVALLAILGVLLLAAYLDAGALARAALALPPLALALSIVSLVLARRSSARLGRGNTIAVLVVAALLTSFEITVVPPAAHSWRKMGCRMNVESISMSMQMYLTDYDRFPDANRWCDELRSYIGSNQVYVCPERPELRCGYALNAALSDLKTSSLTTDPYNTVVIFESDRGWNASGGMGILPGQPRHRGRDMYGYAGGGPEEDSEHPAAQTLSRDAVIHGTAGIFWDPRAKANDGRGKAARGG